jgi:hypothetical protein
MIDSLIRTVVVLCSDVASLSIDGTSILISRRLSRLLMVKTTPSVQLANSQRLRWCFKTGNADA